MSERFIVKEYWNHLFGHEKELTREIIDNAFDLFFRLNGLLADLEVSFVSIRSGWRPEAVNRRVGGSSRSYHLSGQAVDLEDNEKVLAGRILDNSILLAKHGLWLEEPGRTSTWVHLDTGDRPSREVRVFLP